MTRQKFEIGQTVYCHRGGSIHRKAVVTSPNLEKEGFSGRKIHSVGVRYINQKGQPEGAEWPITNRSNLICDEEAFNEMEKAKIVERLRSDIRAYNTFEDELRRYYDQAEIICRTLMGQNLELAHYLRGMFGFLSSYRQLTRDGVKELRADKRGEAARAMGELAAMGEDGPELSKEMGEYL